ncbi:MAG: site-specific DNA-methyltransferase [Bacilli bacterium]
MIDNEQAYLTVMMDEIFGRQNRINTICVNMSNMSGPKVTNAINGKRFPKIKEYILLYCKDKNKYHLDIPKNQKEHWDNEYNLIIPELTIQSALLLSKGEMDEEQLKALSLVSLYDYMVENNVSPQDESWKKENSFRIVASKPNTALLSKAKKNNYFQQVAYLESSRGTKKIIRTDFNRETNTARIELTFALEHMSTYYGDHWDDIVTTGGVAQEGNVVFKASKKPEKLIERVLLCSTKEGDYVLDSFLGSGTTCAVAQKMKRRWIGIEMGEHVYTHCKKRIDEVIDGKDDSGITKTYNWKGGGGYHFYELAPTLIKNDSFGQPVINKLYNSDMLAAAVALHEGYVYSPSKDCYWKQSINNSNSYLFVTTNHVTNEIIESIKAELKESEFLLIVCKSFDSLLPSRCKNISIKKIPQSLLRDCEYDVANYNLNIIRLPLYEEDFENE